MSWPEGWSPRGWALPKALALALPVLALALIQGGTIPLALAVAGSTLVVAWLVFPVPRSTDWPWLVMWVVPLAVGIVSAQLGWPDSGPRWQAVMEAGVLWTIYWSLAYFAARLERAEVRWLVLAVVLIGLFEAVYGLYALSVGSTEILGYWPRQLSARVLTGTFINRNHVVDLLSMSWLLGLGLLLSQRMSSQVRWSLAAPISLVFGVAVFATESRMGVFAFIAGLTAFALWVRGSHHRFRNMVVGALVVGALAALWFGPEDFIERFLALSPDSGRLELWAATGALPARAWWLGVGPGQFGEAFALVQPAELLRAYPQLHNEYLEFVLEFGLLGSAAIAATALWWVRRFWPGRLNVVQRAAACGCLVYAVHALVDFGLQVPGAAVLFWLAIGLIFNPRLLRSSDDGADRDSHRPPRRIESVGGAEV